MIPGEIFYSGKEILLNDNRRTIKIKVINSGDRPVQIGSHFHFFEVNKILKFDREYAYGMKLDIPSGTSVRFEPGEEKEIQLVELGGKKRVFGLNELTQGQATETTKAAAVNRAVLKGFIEK